MKRYQKKVEELEEQNKALQKENEDLKFNLANVSPTSGDSAQKLKEGYIQKLNGLEEQLSEFKRKLNAKSQFSSQKPRGDETTNRFQTQISRVKAQKVELQRKIKEESVQFRLSNALLEKEILQLKKDAWRKEYEMRGLLALNQRLKMVSQRKVVEATVSTKRLNGLLESRKAFSRKTSGAGTGKGPRNQRLMRGVEREPEVKVREHGVCSEYERQTEELAMMVKEVAELKEEAEILKQRNLRCVLEDIEVDCRKKDLEIGNLIQEVKGDCRQKDLEIKDLKQQVAKLKNVVSQLEMQKAEFMHREKPQNSTPMKTLTVDAATSGESRSSITTKCAGIDSEFSEVIDTAEAKKPARIIDSTVKDISGVCCSCSKKSLCKTTKCTCRAAGGSCGTSCGCAPSKCSNREAILIKMDNSPQSNVTDEITNSSSTNKTETCSLAAHGAMLLHSALSDKPAETKENIGPRRKPLSDIKNTLITSNAPKPNRRKKAEKQ